MFSVDLFSLKKCFGVLRDNYQTNSSVKLGTIHLGQRLAPLPLFHRSPEVNQRWEFVRNSGKFSLNKLRLRPASKESVERVVDLQYKKPDTVLGYNNYTSPSVGCLVYFHNGMSMVLFLCMMFLPLTVILRWARVFLPGG